MQTTGWRGYINALRKVSVRIAALAAFGVLLAPLTAYAGSVTLAWDPSPEWWVAGYMVYYRTSSGVYSDSASVNVGNQTTAVINGLTNGVTYHFVVKAYSGFEVFSEPSNEENGPPFSQPPTITDPGNMTVIKGSFTLPITASDPEGDPLAYSAAGLPPGLLINPSTGVISGTVAAGAFPLTATVSDGRTSVSSAPFTLTAVNQAPTITHPGNRTVKPGAFTLPITASDPNGDPLTYSAPVEGLPPGLTINAQTGVISGTVALGTFAITANASDGSADASVTFTLMVVKSPFTDDPLTPGVHVMRAVHITELRTRIDSLRVRSGLSTGGWTDTLGAGPTLIRAIHVTELRAALDAVYSKLGRAQPYADPVLAAGSTFIKAAHITELRAAVAAVE